MRRCGASAASSASTTAAWSCRKTSTVGAVGRTSPNAASPCQVSTVPLLVFSCRQEAGGGRCEKEARPCEERVPLLQSVSAATHERRDSGIGPGYRAAAAAGERDARVSLLLHPPGYSTCAGNDTYLSSSPRPANTRGFSSERLLMFSAVTFIVSVCFPQLVVLPYQVLLHEATRKAAGVQLKGQASFFFFFFFWPTAQLISIQKHWTIIISSSCSFLFFFFLFLPLYLRLLCFLSLFLFLLSLPLPINSVSPL